VNKHSLTPHRGHCGAVVRNWRRSSLPIN